MTPDELRTAIARLQRLMPHDRDVQAVCTALRGVLDLQPLPDTKARRLIRAQRKAYRREYQRKYMAARRAKHRQTTTQAERARILETPNRGERTS
jgi:hypothetical protein